jgi:hypothetical protein
MWADDEGDLVLFVHQTQVEIMVPDLSLIFILVPILVRLK